MSRRTGFTLTELAFIAVITVIFILLSTPFINKIRRRTQVIGCEENLQEIGLGLKLYASEHQGRFPLDLAELIEGGYVEDEMVFDCPSSPHMGDAQESDYHYTSGYTIASPSDAPIVFDKATNHKNGKHVLYISGDIVWEKK
ncbi:MAG: hypothetical protein WBC74_03795 [Candidatus Omnitrophota bacterium]